MNPKYWDVKDQTIPEGWYFVGLTGEAEHVYFLCPTIKGEIQYSVRPATALYGNPLNLMGEGTTVWGPLPNPPEE